MYFFKEYIYVRCNFSLKTEGIRMWKRFLLGENHKPLKELQSQRFYRWLFTFL